MLKRVCEVYEEMVYRLNDIDIRLLHVYRAVVECRGFTSAQAILNISQPTISNHISELEDRLGMRLCDRGRKGFRLSSKGKRVYEEIVNLFKAHEHFQSVTLELKGKMSGYLNIGVIDNVITDSCCPIIKALSLLNQKSEEVTTRLNIMTPLDLERGLLDMSLDVVVGTFDRQLSGLKYDKIYVEKNQLYSGFNNPILKIESEQKLREAVKNARKVTRTYVEGRDLFAIGNDREVGNADVTNLEAAGILILSGRHIGFLPRHFAERWVMKGEMVSILENEYEYESDFYLVKRKNPRQSIIVDTFLEDLSLAIREIQNNLNVVQSLQTFGSKAG